MCQKHHTKNIQDDGCASTYRRFLCPACGKHTVLWLLPMTKIEHLPIKCNRCGQKSIINVSPTSEP